MPSTASSMQRLKITVVSNEGDLLFQQEFGPPDTISIGRSSESDIVLKDKSGKISRCHAVLLHDGVCWEYYNLGVNGTYANGEQVGTLIIKRGSVVRLGKQGPILQFMLQDQGAHQDTESHVLDEAPTASHEARTVTEIIQRVRIGDEAAVQELWNRYSEQIIEVARHSLKNASRRVQDEEDVAGITAGGFPELDHRDQLWRLLVVITTRKAATVIEKDHRQKRGSEDVRGDSTVMSRENEGSGPSSFDQLESEKAPPDIATVMADQTQQLWASLPDETAQRIATLKIEGFTHQQIADRMSINTRTVEQRLKQIRERWQKILDDE